MDSKVILSLFDHSGNWSRPYRECGYEVFQVDIKLGLDVLDLDPSDMPFESVYGILAAPPCTDFASSGAQYWKVKDQDGRTEKSMDLVSKVLDLVNHYNPHFWVVENPVGRLSKLFPELGSPWYFNPWEFAGFSPDPETDRYTKKTGLWGVFNIPKKSPLPPIPGTSPIMKLGGNREKTKELRSVTPLGFSYSFQQSNK
jgi:site-specific DNA-cytosine methylase